MNTMVTLSISLVGIGGLFLVASLLAARITWKQVPTELRGRWLTLIYLIGFFLVGYIFFNIVLISDLSFPVEIVTSGVFFAGAIFVYLIINLSRTTIFKIGDIEADFQDLFENANDLIHSVSPDGKILYVNRSWRETMGYKDREIAAMTVLDLIPADHQEHCKKVLFDVMSGQKTRTEIVFISKSGKRIYLEGNINCRYKKGQPHATRGIYRDITAHKRAEEALRALNESLENRVSERTAEVEKAYDLLLSSRQTLQVILDSMPYGVVIIGKDKRIRNANAAALALMGYNYEKEINGKLCNETLCPSEDGKCPIIDMKEKLDRSERILITQQGRHVPILKTVVPITLDGEQVLLEAVIDITERKMAEDQIRFLAYYDNLTRLPNRAFSTELLNRALTCAERYNTVMATLFVDLDAFKRINDTLGHSIGDELLKAVAERLLNSVRKSDYVSRSKKEADDNDEVSNTVSRLGGDEFIVILTEMSHDYDGGTVANRILHDLAEPFMLDGHEVFISASIGISLYPTDGRDVEALLKNADIAMYHAKEQGKNNFQFYDESMNAMALKRLRLENELRKALEHNEFQLYFQPKVRVENKELIGVEALLRWNHPEHGLLPPSEFISLAEETGLIAPIGEWVLRTACEQAKAWQVDGLQPLTISVNISQRQFEQHLFLESVLDILKNAHLSPHFLELEITESLIMHDPEKIIAMLGELKATGIMISIDDFGTGYSSLEYLRKLPLDALKIDRSFITHAVTNGDDAAIARAVIAMAHTLNLKVIAEGVENSAQLEFLRELDCDEAQGFLFGRPVPANECSRLMSKAIAMN